LNVLPRGLALRRGPRIALVSSHLRRVRGRVGGGRSRFENVLRPRKSTGAAPLWEEAKQPAFSGSPTFSPPPNEIPIFIRSSLHYRKPNLEPTSPPVTVELSRKLCFFARARAELPEALSRHQESFSTASSPPFWIHSEGVFPGPEQATPSFRAMIKTTATARAKFPCGTWFAPIRPEKRPASES